MAKKKFYAVASGKRTGIFDSWDEVKPLTYGVAGALHKSFATREEAERWLAEASGGGGAEVAPSPKKKARVAAPAPAPAIVQPPRGISGDEAAMARYPAHDQKVLRARDDWEAFLSADNVDSGDENESPKQTTGYFPAWENAKYLELLNKYGEPKKANPEALRAFSQEFCYRKKASITSHPSYFNKGAYDAWRAANGGKWVGFTWTAPNGL